MFGSESEVVRLLEEMNTRSFRIIGFRDMQSLAHADPPQYLERFRLNTDDVIWFGSDEGLLALERAMLPYLDFKNVDNRTRHFTQRKS